MKRFLLIITLIISILAILTGCKGVQPKSADQTNPAPQTPPSQIQTPQSQEPQANPPQSSPGTQAGTIKIYLIAIQDNGKSGEKLGTGDSIVPVERSIKDTAAPLKAALEELLSLKEREYGQSGLYNSLYQSNLKVDKVAIVNNTADIRLTGTLTLGGVMDSPRVKAQLEKTALQFSSVKDVKIFLNGKSLDEALSLK